MKTNSTSRMLMALNPLLIVYGVLALEALPLWQKDQAPDLAPTERFLATTD